MSVLDRSALEASPLADLHEIASELGLDGFRRLRKADLIDAIVAQQSGEEPAGASDSDAEADEPKPRARRPRRSRAKAADTDTDTEGEAEAQADEEPAEEKPARPRRSRGGDDDADERPARRGRGRGRDKDDDDERPARSRGGRGRRSDSDEPAGERQASREDEPERVAEGTVEVLGNGSGFLRVNPPEASDEDIYISAAQVRRCELVSGDTVAGPVRPPRRSERYPSLVRIDTINGKAADEVAEGTRFEDLPVTHPSERIALGSEDPTVKAIEWLTPFGKGSRVLIVGGARAGKSEALRRLAAALAGVDGIELTTVLAGARPEEIAEWQAGPTPPVASSTFAAPADAQAQAVERAVETAKRVAARGGDAVVLIDALDGLHLPAARKALAAARKIVDGGSLTIVAVAAAPIGGETTVIALDAALAGTRRFPALDLAGSGVMRPELLVGEAGAEAIAKARAEAQD